METANSRRHSFEVPRDQFGNHEWKYHVFLSFRGEDTRFKFVDHLYHALRRAGINTFRDEEELRKGDEIRPAILSAIEDSRISIILLSKNYASSTWCLDELVKILECRKLTKQLVLPIFYEVDPSEVRYQTGSFGDSMARHEKRYKENTEKVEKWRSALRKVANLSGESYSKGPEVDFIDKIIQKISSYLGGHSLLYLPEKVVGLEYRQMLVVSLLCIGKNDVDVSMVGIYGTGGVGKTTIAKAVYNLVAEQFESTSFFADVRDNTTKHGLAHIQQSILTDVLGKVNINLPNKYRGSVEMKKRLQNKRVLLVLDDVDKLEQLQSLAGGCDWFGAGSRVIITTRDKELLSWHGIEKTYEVEELDKEEALKLLCWNAFRSSVPERRYEDVSTRVLSYAKGIPLALEIIGSHLFGKDIEEWESAMDVFKKRMDNDLFGILKVSYESLGYNEKQIFLDVACFLRGTTVKYSKEVLDSYGFSSKSGLSILEDKCLVKIQMERVWMHDLIRSMGREIVRRESEGEPGKRSGIWFHEDALQILTSDAEVMDRHFSGNYGMHIRGCLKLLPGRKQALYMDAPPSRFPVTGFRAEFFVEIELFGCSINEHAWLGRQRFGSLRVVSFSKSNLKKLPDLSEAWKARRLVLQRCIKLVDISNIQYLVKLEHLDLKGCVLLTGLPSIMHLENLVSIDLSYCRNLKRLRPSLGCLSRLAYLNIRNCKRLENLPISTFTVKSIQSLDISGCSVLIMRASEA